MILITVEEDKKTISSRFRKAVNFVFLDEGQVFIKENPHKTSKSNDFFEYFKTLNIQSIYLKELGYKTFLRLEELGIKVYFVQEATSYNRIKPNDLLLINSKNAREFCSLGHDKKKK